MGEERERKRERGGDGGREGARERDEREGETREIDKGVSGRGER